MSELRPETQALFDGARAVHEPTDADRARVRAALKHAMMTGGAMGAASSAGEGAGAAPRTGAIPPSGMAWKIVVFASILGAIGGGVALTRRPRDAQSQVAPAPLAAAPVATEAPPAELAVAPPDQGSQPPAEPAAHELPQPAQAPAATADRRAGASRPPPSAAKLAVSEEDPLEAETRRLREAHIALQKGEAAKALALLDERQADNAGGQLREDRAAARVLALCKAGRAAEARAAAAEFLRASPRSPHADRVRSACPEAPGVRP